LKERLRGYTDFVLSRVESNLEEYMPFANGPDQIVP